MGQIVKIECQACEGVETYELEGCFLIGKREDGTLCVRHEMDSTEALQVLAHHISEELEKHKGES